MFFNKTANSIATLFFAAVVGAPRISQALVLVEPSVTYISGEFKKTESGTLEKNTLSGPQGGLQFHWLTGFFLLGLEGQYASGTLKPKTGASSDFTATDGFVQLGFHSNRFRLWGSYGVSNDFVVKEASEKTTYTGTVYKASMAYLITNRLNLGLQFTQRSFTDGKNKDGTKFKIDKGETVSKVEVQEYGVQLSFPF